MGQRATPPGHIFMTPQELADPATRQNSLHWTAQQLRRNVREGKVQSRSPIMGQLAQIIAQNRELLEQDQEQEPTLPRASRR